MTTRTTILISSRDVRKRHKFIYDPMIDNEQNQVILLSPDKIGYLSFLLNIFNNLIRNRNLVDYIIVIGVDFTSFYVTVINLLFVRKPLILRLGGNPFRERYSHIITLLLEYKLLYAIKNVVNYFFSIISYAVNTNYIIVEKSLLDNDMLQSLRKKNIGVITQYIDTHNPSNYNNCHSYSGVSRLLTVTNLNCSQKYHGVVNIVEMLNNSSCIHDVKIEFTIVGSGSYLPHLKNFLYNYKASSNLQVTAVGHIDDVGCYYRSACAFIYYSTLDFMPNVLLEAKSYGLPILSNRLKQFEEVLVNDLHGYYIDKIDQNDFDFKLGSLIFDNDNWRRISENNINDILSNYSRIEVGKKIDKFLSGINIG